MRFIHVADIHASRERLPQTLTILETLTERSSKGDIDFIIFSGDFYESTITATKSSGFSDILEAKRELEQYTYLYFLYGTAHHEPSGILDAFYSEKSKVVSEMTNIIEMFPVKKEFWKSGTPEIHLYDFVFIPEPRRSNYVTESYEETNNAINDEIRTFIKSIKKKPDSYNRVVVYHGEVKGAVYQNGESASSPTAIPKTLLQSLNADYYALGHIHKPQEVFSNAWYAGSACPKNFGETHDGCYNLVTIENGKTEVERISFGFPMYETFYLQRYNDRTLETSLHFHKNFTNKYLRVISDCTKEERALINIKTEQDNIKKRTNAISVKLELNINEGETVVKSEVTKRKSLVEKMEEYAKEKAFKIPAYAKELLQNIQDNTLAKLAYPQHSFELLYLSLRGAIGIRDGQGKENFELNFENLEGGVVCLVGHNGAGKSTIVENCHPYPKMLSRDGTLKEHFYLKDSHRILIYKDENGLYYKISMLIDAKTSTGKTSYFVETSKDREVWTSVSDVDGSLETYKKWVDETFGSIDVFLRTAFFAKEQTKDAKDISVTTKGERMELLSKLAGTEQLKEVSLTAREQRKEVEKSADKIETEINSYSHFEETITQNEKDIKNWKEELAQEKEELSVTEKEVTELKLRDAEYQKVRAVAEANAALYEQYKNQLEDKSNELKNFDCASGHKDLFDTVAEYNEITSRNKPLIEQKSKELSEKQETLDSVVKEVSVLKDEISKKMLRAGKIEGNIDYLKTQITDIKDVCPTCGAPLSEHQKEELFSHVNDNKIMLKNAEKEQRELKKAIGELNLKIVEVDITDSLREGISVLRTELRNLEDEVEKAEKKTKKLDPIYFDYSYDDVCKKVNELKTDCKELESKMDDIVFSDTIKDVSEELAVKQSELENLNDVINEITSNIKAAEKENARCKKELEAVTDKKMELVELKDKITALNFIEETFSNNGIPAIELRESAPEIADITNKILKDSYGSKFEIRFGSTSELKAKHKVNEDFNIIVYDTENFDEKTIDLVSSGERIWIKQALFYAFSIVQMNRTGFNFRTRLIDESDGSLDGTLRPKYLRMVESAHKFSDSRVTVLITHSQEIKDIAQQIIEI